MELDVYLWVEDITVFIRELIRLFGRLFPGSRMEYEERYDSLDGVLYRRIYLGGPGGPGIGVCIDDNDDDDGDDDGSYFEFAAAEYGTDVNLHLWFDVFSTDCERVSMEVAPIVNWMMETSDTDLAIENEGGALIFKRARGEIYYGREDEWLPGDYIPVKHLNFNREKAVEFTQEDEWVFCSEESIREMERKRKEKQEASDSVKQ